MFVVFPPIYTMTYMIQTAYFKPNNFLPVVPYTCLALAWGLCEGYRFASARLPVLGGSRWPATLAVLVLAVLAIWPGLAYVYRSVTPTTRDQAVGFLASRLQPPTTRWVQMEEWQEPEPFWEGRKYLGSRLPGVLRHDALHPLGDRKARSQRRLDLQARQALGSRCRSLHTACRGARQQTMWRSFHRSSSRAAGRPWWPSPRATPAAGRRPACPCNAAQLMKRVWSPSCRSSPHPVTTPSTSSYGAPWGFWEAVTSS